LTNKINLGKETDLKEVKTERITGKPCQPLSESPKQNSHQYKIQTQLQPEHDQSTLSIKSSPLSLAISTCQLSRVPIAKGGQLFAVEEPDPRGHQIIFSRMAEYVTDISP
jgi:hypothetical protein